MSRGSIRRDRRTGTWLFVVDLPALDGQRRQAFRRGFATRKAAQLALDELRSSLTTGRMVEPSRITFGAYLTERWLPALDQDTKLKPTTVFSYRQIAKHLTRHVGGVRLNQLRGDQLTGLYGRMRADGYAERTVRLVHVTAHRALRDAIRWRLVAFNAADDAIAPAKGRPDPKAWSAQDVHCFLSAAATDRWSALWRLAATTGMRRGELAALRWDAVDLDGQTLMVCRNMPVVDGRPVDGTPKNDRTRQISLDRGTVAALREWRRVQLEERLAMGNGWQGADRAFTWPDGSLLHPDVISRTFVRIRDRAGLTRLSLHNLRHAWATHALACGMDVKDVSTRLGHSSVGVTYDMYVAPSSERDARAAQVVAELYDAVKDQPG